MQVSNRDAEPSGCEFGSGEESQNCGRSLQKWNRPLTVGSSQKRVANPEPPLGAPDRRPKHRIRPEEVEHPRRPHSRIARQREILNRVPPENAAKGVAG